MYKVALLRGCVLLARLTHWSDQHIAITNVQCMSTLMSLDNDTVVCNGMWFNFTFECNLCVSKSFQKRSADAVCH